MFKITQFAALWMITSVALGQEMIPHSPPRLDSEWVISGHWVCADGTNEFEWHSGRGPNCDAAQLALDDILDPVNPGLVCTDVNGENPQPAIKEYAECYEDGGGGGGGGGGEGFRLNATPPQNGPWVIRLICQFGNGKTLAARGTGCTYCEAYQKAWGTIQRLAKTNCGVCCCSGKCVVLEQPCCQTVSPRPSRTHRRYR